MLLLALFMLILRNPACCLGAEQPPVDFEEEASLTEEEDEALRESIRRKNEDVREDASKKKEIRMVENLEVSFRYLPEEGLFCYTFPDGSGFSMSSPLGSLGNVPVTLRAEGDARIWAMTRDGENCLPGRETAKESIPEPAKESNPEAVEEGVPITEEESVPAAAEETIPVPEDITEASVRETGSYNFHIDESFFLPGKTTWYDFYGAFRIIDPSDPIWIHVIYPPYGYRVSKMKIDGRRFSVGDGQFLSLEQDGKYEIDFEPLSPGAPAWKTEFIRDTLPPGLIFSEKIDGGVLRTPLRFRPTEEGAGVRVYLNGKETAVPEGLLAASGEYRLEVSDALQNTRTYRVRIKLDRVISPVWYIGLLAALLIMGSAVVLFSYKGMRII